MENTTNLALPYIMPAQAQKHITHNEAIRKLDAIIQISVLDQGLGAPPVSPSEGDRYIVAANASGIWADHAGELAAFQNGSWTYFQPVEGWLVWIEDEQRFVVFSDDNWVDANGDMEQTDMLGINAQADTTNRLSITSPAVLFNNESGSIQAKLNKNALEDTASILFQSGFSGRAELGLNGEDDFSFKVSSDGSNFETALAIDASSGQVHLPHTPTFRLSGSFRIYLYTDQRWVSTSHPYYGTSYYQAAENCGAGVDPIQEWENIGYVLPKGVTIHKMHITGRTNTSEIADIEFQLSTRIPSPIEGWETGLNTDSEVQVTQVHRDLFMNPSIGTGFTGPSNYLRTRSIDLNFTMPETGFVDLFARSTNAPSANRYFYSNLVIECSY